MAQRTDCHRPAAIVPANYSYYCSYALGTVVNGWPCPAWNLEAVEALRAQKAFVKTGGLGHCSVCGTKFIYGDVWCHEPSGEYLHIGQDCAKKYALLADRSEFELQHLRVKVAAVREAKKAINAEARREFLEAHPGLAEALETDHPICRDIKAAFHSYHGLSTKQVQLVMKIAAEALKPAAEQEKTVAAPITASRQTFRGTVVATKIQEGQYGASYKMAVKVSTDAGVWLAWGTIPAAMLEAVPACRAGRVANLRGSEVEVTAALKAGRDSHFALLVRPSGKVLKLTAEMEAEKETLTAAGLWK